MELLDYRPVFPILAFVIIVFCLIFLLFWVLTTMTLSKMRNEIDDLRKQVRVAGQFRSLETSNSPFEIEDSKEREPPEELATRSIAAERQANMRAQATQDVGDHDKTPSHAETMNETHVDRTPRNNLDSSGPGKKRKVRIKKISGKDTDLRVGSSFIGLEGKPAEVGKKYCVLLDDRMIFRSSRVVEITDSHIQTRNSVYEIVEMEED